MRLREAEMMGLQVSQYEQSAEERVANRMQWQQLAHEFSHHGVPRRHSRGRSTTST